VTPNAIIMSTPAHISNIETNYGMIYYSITVFTTLCLLDDVLVDGSYAHA